jgi:hypothetical protein
MMLGLVGEYLGRLYLGHTGTPQYVVRYTLGPNSPAEGSLASLGPHPGGER